MTRLPPGLRDVRRARQHRATGAPPRAHPRRYRLRQPLANTPGQRRAPSCSAAPASEPAPPPRSSWPTLEQATGDIARRAARDQRHRIRPRRDPPATSPANEQPGRTRTTTPPGQPTRPPPMQVTAAPLLHRSLKSTGHAENSAFTRAHNYTELRIPMRYCGEEAVATDVEPLVP